MRNAELKELCWYSVASGYVTAMTVIDVVAHDLLMAAIGAAFVGLYGYLAFRIYQDLV